MLLDCLVYKRGEGRVDLTVWRPNCNEDNKLYRVNYTSMAAWRIGEGQVPVKEKNVDLVVKLLYYTT